MVSYVGNSRNGQWAQLEHIQLNEIDTPLKSCLISNLLAPPLSLSLCPAQFKERHSTLTSIMVTSNVWAGEKGTSMNFGEVASVDALGWITIFLFSSEMLFLFNDFSRVGFFYSFILGSFFVLFKNICSWFFPLAYISLLSL